MNLMEVLDGYCEEFVNLVTFGQLQAIREMYESWSASVGYIEPNILGYAFALFVVVIRFIVPVVLVYYLVIRNIFKNTYIRIALISAFSVAYALFYFDPIIIFEQASISVTRFYHFLLDLPNVQTEPVIFTFLTNGLAVFILRCIVVFVSTWFMFYLLTIFVTAIFWVVTAGRSIWQFTDRSMRAVVTQMMVVFLLFYPIVGAFRAFMTVLAVVVGMVNIRDSFYAIRGYQKVCYSVGGEVKCKWAK